VSPLKADLNSGVPPNCTAFFIVSPLVPVVFPSISAHNFPSHFTGTATIFASCFKILTGFITFCILSILLATFVYPPVFATLATIPNPPISAVSVSAGFSTKAFFNFQGVPYCSTIFAPIASIILASSVAGTSFPHSWLDIAFAIP